MSLEYITAPRSYPVPLDSRVAMSLGGIDAYARPIAMTPALFANAIDEVETTAATPTGVAELLAVSRRLYEHGCFVYEFVTIGVHYGCLAVEAALAELLQRPKDSFADLVKRATSLGHINEPTHELLDEAIRMWRNEFSHARDQTVWTPVMAAIAIRKTHALIAALYPDADAKPSAGGQY